MILMLTFLLNLGCGEKKETQTVEPIVLPENTKSFFTEHSSWTGMTTLDEENSLEFSVTFEVREGVVFGKMSIPMQNAFDLPLDDIQLVNGELSFVLKPPRAPKFAWAYYNFPAAEETLKEKEFLEGTLTQVKRSFPTTMNEGALEKRNRPQTPQPPFDYLQRDVIVENANDGAKLAGTLTYPKGEGKFPVAVLITGSGPQDRDETIFEHKPFWVIADHLTKNGIAVLRLDDRGVGESTGVRDDLTSLIFAEDISFALDFLAEQPEIDGHRMGLIGHSEGGIIAAIVGSQREDLGFIVSLAGTGVSGLEVLVRQGVDLLEIEDGLTEEQKQDLRDKLRANYQPNMTEEEEKRVVFDLLEYQLKLSKQKLSKEEKEEIVNGAIAVKKTPWMQTFISLDPAEYWRKVKAPVYALNGDLDLQVAAEVNLPTIESALKEGGNEEVKTQRFISLNHLFQTAKKGTISEYAQIEETVAPEVLESMSSWILNQTKEDKETIEQ